MFDLVDQLLVEVERLAKSSIRLPKPGLFIKTSLGHDGNPFEAEELEVEPRTDELCILCALSPLMTANLFA